MYRLHARVDGKGWGFVGWDYWDTGTDFVTHYTGRVVGNLADPEGKHMRCKFQLVHPSNGMAGGGQGDCRLPENAAGYARRPAATTVVIARQALLEVTAENG